MSKMKFKIPPMVAKLTAVGKVVNPDGSTREIRLEGNLPLIQEKERGDNSTSGDDNRSD